MKTPIFNDIITDGNTERITADVKHTPLVPESTANADVAAAVPENLADLPPQFAAELEKQQAAEATAQAEAMQAEAAAQMQLYQQHEVAQQQAQMVQPVLDYEEQADLLVTLSDSVQQLAFSKAAERRYFTADERKIIREIKRKQRSNESITADEKQLYEDWKKYLEFKDLLPYDNKEYEMLRKPLAKVLEQQQANLDPKTALLLAALMVAAPRFASMVALRSDLNR